MKKKTGNAILRGVASEIEPSPKNLFDSPEYWLGRLASYSGMIPLEEVEGRNPPSKTARIKIEKQIPGVFRAMQETIRQMNKHYRHSFNARISSQINLRAAAQ